MGKTLLTSPTELKIVHRGPDTFLVNFKFAGPDDRPNGATLPVHVSEQLDVWQKEARKEHQPVSTDLIFRFQVGETMTEQTVYIRPHGAGIWSWLLYTPSQDVKLSLSYGTMQGHVFCQARFSSFLLNAIGAEQAIIDVESMLYDFMGEMIYQQASEIHLCVDLQGFDFSTIDPHHAFVSRVVAIRDRLLVPEEEELASGLSPSEIIRLEEKIEQDKREGVFEPSLSSTHRRIATIDFGSHGSDISAQIYNKTVEIKKHRKDWFEPVWMANGWDGESEVWRLEVRLKRKKLADFGLNEAFDVLSKLEALWQYATVEWLRFVDLSVSGDSNRSRLSTHPVWEPLQSAYSSRSDRVDTVRDAAGELSCRIAYLEAVKPDVLLKQAVAIESHDRLLVQPWLSVEECCSFLAPVAFSSPQVRAVSLRMLARLGENRFLACQREAVAAADALVAADAETGEAPSLELVRELAHEALTQLTPEQVSSVVSRLSPELFREVCTTLIKKRRLMTSRSACIAGAVGMIRSALALARDETARKHPDLLSSLVWFFGEVVKYDRKMGRVHQEEVMRKQVAYGLMTEKEFDEERRLYGVELASEDWHKLSLVLRHMSGRDKPDAPVFDDVDVVDTDDDVA